MQLSRYEQETVICYNEEEKTATVDTCNKALQRALAKAGAKPTRQDEYSQCFVVPKSWVKVRPPRKVSDEQREAARKRLQKTLQKAQAGRLDRQSYVPEDLPVENPMQISARGQENGFENPRP